MRARVKECANCTLIGDFPFLRSSWARYVFVYVKKELKTDVCKFRMITEIYFSITSYDISFDFLLIFAYLPSSE